MIKINYKSDFKINESSETVAMEVPFVFSYYVFDNKKYVVSFDGHNYVNCERKEDGSLDVIFNQPEFGIGHLKVERKYAVDDKAFADGVFDVVTVDKTDVFITSGQTFETYVKTLVVPPYLKGDKGDPMTWDTMTETERGELVHDVAEAIDPEMVMTENEKARQEAEQSRQTAEQQRSATFNTLKGEMQSAINAGNEAATNAQKVVNEYDTKVAEQDSKLTELGSEQKYIGATLDKETNKMIPELYLTGIDKSKVYNIYGIINGESSRSVLIYDSNGSEPDIYVALAYTTDLSKDVIKVEEREGSGINGWIVVNWDLVPSGTNNPFSIINIDSVCSLANNPRIAAEIKNSVFDTEIKYLKEKDNESEGKINQINADILVKDSYSESIIPSYVSGFGVNNTGGLFESSDYGYFAPIHLPTNKCIELNNGNTLYQGHRVSVFYQCDKDGIFIKPLVIGDGSSLKAEYINSTDADMYIGISCKTEDLKYRIYNLIKINEKTKQLEENLKFESNRLTKLDGQQVKEVTLEDIGVRRTGYYINMLDGSQKNSSTAIITNAIYLNPYDVIEAYSGGTGFAMIAKSETQPNNYTVFDVIETADNIKSPKKHIVKEAGYYSFSGRNSEQGESALTVKITKYEYGGKLGELEWKVVEMYDGKTTTTEFTLDDLDNDGALIGYYLHNTQLRIIESSGTIITKPIFLHKGDSVGCATGGTGLLLFGKSPSGTIHKGTTGFSSISGTATTYNGVVEEDGWYVFSGRYGRTDGTNLVVNIKSYTKEKNVYGLLDEKADKSDIEDLIASGNTTGFALSIGADSVKDEIQSSPWFDMVDNDGTTYGTYLDDKIDSVPQGDSFIFISDVHYSGNKKQSAKLIDYVRRRLGVKTIIHGGDVINESPTIAGAAKEWLDFNRDFVFRIGGDFKQVCGDHDHNGRYADTGQALSYQFIQRVMNGYNIKELTFDTLYDEQIKEVSSVNSWTGNDKKEYDAWKKMHYYFDDSTIKTRFVVLHTGWTGDVGLAVDKLGSNVLSEANALYLQMDFLYQSLISSPNGYNVVIVGHNVIGNKGYTVNIGGGTGTRYNVNEIVWKGAWKNVTQMLRAFKNKTSITLNYRDWSGDGLKSKSFDFAAAKTPNLVFCMGGDVHWDILAKTDTSENLTPVTNATSLGNIIPNEGTISKNDILHALTMTDGADRGYRAIIAPPSDSYNDEVDSALASNPNTDGTLDSQAFDIVTITDDAIHFTRIGSGKDRVVYISE